ncbi:MAG: hypothetical protein ABIN94_05990 [Ferruginibacter sp.]
MEKTDNILNNLKMPASPAEGSPADKSLEEILMMAIFQISSLRCLVGMVETGAARPNFGDRIITAS